MSFIAREGLGNPRSPQLEVPGEGDTKILPFQSMGEFKHLDKQGNDSGPIFEVRCLGDYNLSDLSWRAKAESAFNRLQELFDEKDGCKISEGSPPKKSKPDQM